MENVKHAYFIEKDSEDPDGYCSGCAALLVSGGVPMEKVAGFEVECARCDKALPKVKR